MLKDEKDRFVFIFFLTKFLPFFEKTNFFSGDVDGVKIFIYTTGTFFCSSPSPLRQLKILFFLLMNEKNCFLFLSTQLSEIKTQRVVKS
jgi:hypothetical protein